MADKMTLHSIQPNVDVLMLRLQHHVQAPENAARSLPAACFTDARLYELEKTQVLESGWLSLAHVSQLPNLGDYLTVDLLDEPLVVVRGKDNVIRVLSRVCQHRGMDMMTPIYGNCKPQGNTKSFRCPYHLWSYDLQGRLVAAPEMRESTCHAGDDVKLHEFRSEIFEGLIFVNLDGQAGPLAERLQPLQEQLAKWGMAEAVMVWQQEWACPFNWKVLVENFMEPYHHIGSHRTTLEPMMPARETATMPEGGNDYLAVKLPLNAGLRAELSTTGKLAMPGFTPFPKLTAEDQQAWWVFLIHPLCLLFVGHDRLFWYRIIPTGPETCQLLTTMEVHPSALLAPDYQARLEEGIVAAVAFHMEDMEACTGVQRGARSRAYTQGALSRLEGPLVRFHRALVHRLQDAHQYENATS